MRSLAIAVLLVACSGGAPPEIDANPLGPMCAKKDFDRCGEEHDCDSLMCINFPQFQVCSLACTAGGTPCPKDKTGAAATCDNGVCRPAEPNMCHL